MLKIDDFTIGLLFIALEHTLIICSNRFSFFKGKRESSFVALSALALTGALLLYRWIAPFLEDVDWWATSILWAVLIGLIAVAARRLWLDEKNRTLKEEIGGNEHKDFYLKIRDRSFFDPLDEGRSSQYVVEAAFIPLQPAHIAWVRLEWAERNREQDDNYITKIEPIEPPFPKTLERVETHKLRFLLKEKQRRGGIRLAALVGDKIVHSEWRSTVDSLKEIELLAARG